MSLVEIWIKESELQEYRDLMEQLIFFYDEAVNFSLGFDRYQEYKVIKGSGKRKVHLAGREKVRKGYVIMEALRNLRQKEYDDLKNGKFSEDRREQSRLMSLLKPNLELTPETALKPATGPTYEEWLKTKGLQQTWLSFKQYQSEYPHSAKHQWVKKNSGTLGASTSS